MTGCHSKLVVSRGASSAAAGSLLSQSAQDLEVLQALLLPLVLEKQNAPKKGKFQVDVPDIDKWFFCRVELETAVFRILA